MVSMHSSLVALKTIDSWSIVMAFKFLCTTLEKYFKLPLNMQRPTVINELSKERCATCKGRTSVMLCGYMYTYNVATGNCMSTYSYI